MKTLTKFLGIIAVGAVIAAGLTACKPTPIELDEEVLAAMNNASWVVKPVYYSPPGPQSTDFTIGDKTEAAYFGRISVTLGLEKYKWYALTAPEFPGAYYYYIRQINGPLVFKSTTIDDEKFAWYNTLLNASWDVKVLPNQPSFNGFEQLPWKENRWEYNYADQVSRSGGYDGDGKWYELTSREFPGVTFYYFPPDMTGMIIGSPATIYMKGKLL